MYVAVVVFFVFLLTPAMAQQKLGDVVTEAGFDWMIGKWVGTVEEQKVELEWKWALDKHVIFVDVKAGEYRSHSMIMYVASRDEVIEVGADNQGATERGKWRTEGDNAVVRSEETNVYGQIEKSEGVISKLDVNTIKITLYNVDENDRRTVEPQWVLTLKRQRAKVEPPKAVPVVQDFTLSGTLSQSGMNGKMAHLKLVSEGANPGMVALYSTSATFNAGEASYSVRGIKKGRYTLWLFIDANGNASEVYAMPDTGDYWARFDIDISGDTTRDIETWSAF
jgi:hypothetical protein